MISIAFNGISRSIALYLASTCWSHFRALMPLITSRYWFMYDENRFVHYQPRKIILNGTYKSQIPDITTHLQVPETVLREKANCLMPLSNLLYLSVLPEGNYTSVDLPFLRVQFPPNIQHLYWKGNHPFDISIMKSLQRVTHLSLNHNLSQAQLAALPKTLKSLHFSEHVTSIPPQTTYSFPLLEDLRWGINAAYPPSLIAPSIKRLVFGKTATIDNQSFSTALVHIEFTSVVNQDIAPLLPPQLRFLKFNKACSVNLARLPPALHTLILSTSDFRLPLVTQSNALDNLPASLRHLSIGVQNSEVCFNHPLHHLPPNLDRLELYVTMYTHTLKNLPSNLSKIILKTHGEAPEIEIRNLSYLKSLVFSADTFCLDPLQGLPPSLKSLSLSGILLVFDDLHPMPKYLQKLSLEFFNYPYYLIPRCLRKFSHMMFELDHPLCDLPKYLTHLSIFINKYNPKYAFEALPSTLTELCIYSSLYSLEDLPSSLRTLHLTLPSFPSDRVKLQFPNGLEKLYFHTFASLPDIAFHLPTLPSSLILLALPEKHANFAKNIPSKVLVKFQDQNMF